MAGLVSAILVWLNVFYRSDVIRVGNREELIRMYPWDALFLHPTCTDPLLPVSTIGGAIMVFTSLLGFSGILLNYRPFLAVYTVLLWVCLAFIVAPGYITYKRRTFNLEGKINLQWSRSLGTVGRLRVQDALRCCGYFSPSIEATVSPLCYPRSVEEGCKSPYLKLERVVLKTWYIVAFSLVPPHILIILAGLLCSNHVTYRFGKGLTPKRYRLDMDSMAVIMNDYATQIASQYGPDVAAEAVSRSSLHLDSRPGSRAGSRRGSIAGGSSQGHGLAGGSRLAQSTSYNSPFDDETDNQQYENASQQYHDAAAGGNRYADADLYSDDHHAAGSSSRHNQGGWAQ